jgi:hypothetical protein
MKIKLKTPFYHRNHNQRPHYHQSPPPLYSHSKPQCSWRTRNAFKMTSRKNTCSICWGTSGLSQHYCSEGLNMGRLLITSTLAATKKVQPFLYLRLKMGTALAASPQLSGSHPLSLYEIGVPPYST